MSVRRLTAVVHQEENLYVAECPEIGTVSQGTSVEEAVVNLKEDGALPGGISTGNQNGTAIVVNFEEEVV
jgi:predicted RNase H-like HicB family nuclease